MHQTEIQKYPFHNYNNDFTKWPSKQDLNRIKVKGTCSRMQKHTLYKKIKRPRTIRVLMKLPFPPQLKHIHNFIALWFLPNYQMQLPK